MISFIWNSRKEKVTCQKPTRSKREWLQRHMKLFRLTKMFYYHNCSVAYRTVRFCQNSQNFLLKNWQNLRCKNLTISPNCRKKEEWQSEKEELSPKITQGFETSANICNFSSYVLKKIKVFSNTANHCICQWSTYLTQNWPMQELRTAEFALVESECC